MDASRSVLVALAVFGTLAARSTVTEPTYLEREVTRLRAPWTGVVAGGAALIAGAVYLADGGPDLGTPETPKENRPDAVGAANMLIGGAALMVGGIRLSKPRSSGAAEARVEIVPTILPVAERPRVGLTLHARF